jgi:hypothetical protein
MLHMFKCERAILHLVDITLLGVVFFSLQVSSVSTNLFPAAYLQVGSISNQDKGHMLQVKRGTLFSNTFPDSSYNVSTRRTRTFHLRVYLHPRTLGVKLFDTLYLINKCHIT